MGDSLKKSSEAVMLNKLIKIYSCFSEQKSENIYTDYDQLVRGLWHKEIRYKGVQALAIAVQHNQNMIEAWQTICEEIVNNRYNNDGRILILLYTFGDLLTYIGFPWEIILAKLHSLSSDNLYRFLERKYLSSKKQAYDHPYYPCSGDIEDIEIDQMDEIILSPYFTISLDIYPR